MKKTTLILLAIIIYHGSILAQTVVSEISGITKVDTITVGNIDPKSQLHVQEGGDVLFGADTIDGGKKLIWNAEKSALRAGGVDDDDWDPDNIGGYSVAFGLNTKAIEDYTMAWGVNNNAVRAVATAWGANNNATGYYSTAWGESNKTPGGYSTAWGALNETSGENSTAFGRNNLSQSINEVVIGRYADTVSHANPNSWESDDQLFVVGNGSSTTDRNNALTVYKNGNSKVTGFTKLGDNAPSIKVKKLTGNMGANPTGQVSIPHNLDLDKIISVTVLAVTPDIFSVRLIYPPNPMTTYNWDIINDEVRIHKVNTSNLKNYDLRIMITYEE